MAYGKAIELFLVNGTADNLVTAELSNWNGKAIKIPRTEVSGCDRDDKVSDRAVANGSDVFDHPSIRVLLFGINLQPLEEVIIGGIESAEPCLQPVG